jgi:glutamate mutase epsilon subunit
MNASNCRKINVILNNKKIDSLEYTKNFKDFKEAILNKYNLVAADIYFIDENGFNNLVETQKQFNKFLENSKETPQFLIDENIQGYQGSAGEKFDLRNLKLNNEYTDMKNDKKSRNTLEIIKKEKSLIKRKLRDLKSHNHNKCDNHEEQEILIATLKEYKNFQKKRLVRKFWKSSEKSNHKDEVIYA